jgi:alpha-amylase/alpha-mannosidase (GH57 family)
MELSMRPALVIHGHFYQPPRENPWTDIVDRESSAGAFHDWNERIHYECYRPNGWARIIDGYGRVERIVNNYKYMSFNFGPTLMSWIERHHPETYERILEADRESVKMHGGHGNAIAQGYNHAILPLCNERDRRTQIRWGLIDFRHRFNREPEGFWLPETACNDETLEALIDEKIKFVILSPYQAERVRHIGSHDWHNVGNGSIDPSIPYKFFHRDGSGRSIAIFFYDGPIARAIAFEGALASSQGLLDRLSKASRGPGRLVHIATDGESYGHHFHFGDRCLAHALDVEAPARGFWITNYGEFLEHHPPTMEVEIKKGPNGEGTAWSCAHGVGRWCRDCSCQGGGCEGWNQEWRTPLRKALDLLRNEAMRYFEATKGDLFIDPWAARDEYIELVVDRSRSREDFLFRHAGRRLHEMEQVRALTFLELQRNAMLMYTSCGWFFSDISGLETVQIMKYAGRVLDLIDELHLASPQEKFLEVLAEAKSNILEMGNGAQVFMRFVEPCKVSPQNLTAHLAITSILDNSEETGELGGYYYQRTDFQKRQHSRLTLATGRLALESIATGKQLEYAFATLHLGGVDFYCVLKHFPGARSFALSTEKLWSNFRIASLPTVLRVVQEEFGPNEYGLQHVLAEGKQQILDVVFGNLVNHFADEYAFLYEENRRSIEMLHEVGLELPTEFRTAAELTLSRRFEEEVRSRQQSQRAEDYQKAIDIAEEVEKFGYNINRSNACRIFEDMITRAIQYAINNAHPEAFRTALELLSLIKRLRINANLEKAQETIYQAIKDGLIINEDIREMGLQIGLAPTLFTQMQAATSKPSLILETR